MVASRDASGLRRGRPCAHRGITLFAHNATEMPSIFNFLLRVLLLAAGLVFAASVMAAFVLLLALWSVRALWARLTGRPVTPFVMRMASGSAFAGMMRRAPPASRTPRADAIARPRRELADITDAEPRSPAS
jgi:hypothetical protein